jgi:predicted cobalt transporter CbtA
MGSAIPAWAETEHAQTVEGVRRLIFMIVTTLIVSVGTALFLHDVLHMGSGPRRDGLLVVIPGMCWILLRVWLHQKSKNDMRGVGGG